MVEYESSKSRRRKEIKQMLQQQKQLGSAEAGAEAPAHETGKHDHRPATLIGKAKKFYENHYKKMLILTIGLLIIAIVLIGIKVATTGDFINKGTSLKGGTTITFENAPDVDILKLMTDLKVEFPKQDLNVRELSATGVQLGIIIDTDATSTEDIDAVINFIKEKLPEAERGYSIETMGGSLGSSFFKQVLLAMVIAFCFMSIVVFMLFKTFVPSSAVIICAFADIVETIAVVNILGMKVSTAGIAAFLMLIGYSVDTDILLTTHIVKRKEGTIVDRTFTAMKTGLLMTFTTIGAVTAGLIFSESDVIRQIMTILLIGLVFDILNTWIQNATILMVYENRKESQAKNE